MLRSFLTRLVDPAARAVLLVPCLLICLACATPFPFENLEEGMTAETVSERFGAPRAMETMPGGLDSYWTYANRELEVGAVILGWPWAPLFVAVSWLSNFEWDDPYMGTSDVVLRFEGEKLVRWEVLEPVPVVSSGSTWHWQHQWEWSKDTRHHQRGGHGS